MSADSGANEERERVFIGDEGRDRILEAVRRLLDEPGQGYRLRTGGTWGIGKTRLVDELDARSRDRAVVLHVKAGSHVPSAAREGEKTETVDVVRNWNSYARILTHLIRSTPKTEEWGTLVEKIEAAQQAVADVRTEKMHFEWDIDVRGDVDLSDQARFASPNVHQTEPLERLEAAIGAGREQLRSAFAKTVDRVGGASGAVILVDEFDRLRGHEVAKWVLDLVTAPEHAVVVVATRVVGEEQAAGTRPVEGAELQPFGPREVRLYLRHRLGEEAVDDALVDRALRFSGGLPQAIGMAADLIEQRRRTGGELLLEDVSVDPATATTKLLSAIVEEVPEEDVKQLLKEARFARRIDLELIHFLLCGSRYEDASAEERKRAQAALAALRGYSFVEELDGDDKLGRFRFHEYITRAQADPDDSTLDVDEEGVHAQLAAYYEQRLDDFEEDRSEESSYMQLYKLENPAWQALMREWLYHLSRLDRADTREQARLALARVFLQAFWWYGCYVRFDFCEELVTDWERLQARDEDLTGRLRELLASYPTAYDKQDKGNWPKVEQAMRTLHDDLGLDTRIPLDDEGVDDERDRKQLSNRRWVRALTSLFRGHACRFRTGSGDLAMSHFADALKYFRADGETSALAWTTFELAELKLELGDADGAADSLRDAAGLLAHAVEEEDENQDYELLANLHRLRGDLAGRKEDWELAVDSTARAVLAAYAFLGEPQPPDPYTVAFYEEMRDRASRRLRELREKLGADAATPEQRLLEKLEPLRGPFGLEDGVGAELESLLPPPPAKLGPAALEDETFATTARRALLHIQQDPGNAELAAASSAQLAPPPAASRGLEH